MDIKVYSDKQEVASAFAKYIATVINVENTVHISLSGGSTPKVLFDLLAEEYKETINWSNVHFYWGDERCVGPEDEQSNYKMTVDHLFSKIDIPTENIHRIIGENEPQEEALRYAREMYENVITRNRVPIFDLIILGMGDDGHTASIFPYEIDLWDAEETTVVATHPNSGQKRVSITGQVINAARAVALLVTGTGKCEKVYEILKEKEGFKKYPASFVNPSSGNLTWYLDTAAHQKMV